jgi:hypothetical protein
MTPTPRRMGIRLPPSESDRDALDAIFGTLSEGVKTVAEGFYDPDDDWAPIWIVLAPAGLGTVLTGDLHKHDMTEYVGRYARKVGAIGIGHLHSSWVVMAEDGISDGRYDEIVRQMRAQDGSTEGIPERREVLLLATYTATAWASYLARIERHAGHPPTLGPFERWGSDDPAKVSMEGPMVDPLQDALKRIG